MGVRMIPIVAVVSEDAFHAMNDHMSGLENPTPGLELAMADNGWTFEALVAGALIAAALRVPNPKPPARDPEATANEAESR